MVTFQSRSMPPPMARFIQVSESDSVAVSVSNGENAAAMENIRFVLEEQLGGRIIGTNDPDEEYAESIASPIKEAQALVAGNRMSVLWRLLSYLKPYRQQVVFGMSAATIITLVSLVPPYLAGYLIDRVVRPVQEGTLSIATMS